LLDISETTACFYAIALYWGAQLKILAPIQNRNIALAKRFFSEY
jgi:hypothetical protein